MVSLEILLQFMSLVLNLDSSWDIPSRELSVGNILVNRSEYGTNQTSRQRLLNLCVVLNMHLMIMKLKFNCHFSEIPTLVTTIFLI